MTCVVPAFRHLHRIMKGISRNNSRSYQSKEQVSVCVYMHVCCVCVCTCMCAGCVCTCMCAGCVCVHACVLGGSSCVHTLCLCSHQLQISDLRKQYDLLKMTTSSLIRWQTKAAERDISTMGAEWGGVEVGVRVGWG